jgi:hypothetical protein
MADGQRETDEVGDTGLSPHPPRVVTRYREGDILLGRFKVVRPVGRGGMGEVYEVRDLRLHARVAMKTVREPDDPGLNDIVQVNVPTSPFVAPIHWEMR